MKRSTNLNTLARPKIYSTAIAPVVSILPVGGPLVALHKCIGPGAAGCTVYANTTHLSTEGTVQYPDLALGAKWIRDAGIIHTTCDGIASCIFSEELQYSI